MEKTEKDKTMNIKRNILTAPENCAFCHLQMKGDEKTENLGTKGRAMTIHSLVNHFLEKTDKNTATLT